MYMITLKYEQPLFEKINTYLKQIKTVLKSKIHIFVAS